VIPNGSKVSGGADPNKMSVQEIWDLVTQPNAHDHSKTKKPMELGWPGLTMFYQESHLAKKDIPKPSDGFAYEKYIWNDRVDEIAKEGSKLSGHATTPLVVES
jgi:hypothetical protein